MSLNPCFNYAAGYCRFGDRCRYSHDPDIIEAYRQRSGGRGRGGGFGGRGRGRGAGAAAVASASAFGSRRRESGPFDTPFHGVLDRLLGISDHRGPLHAFFERRGSYHPDFLDYDNASEDYELYMESGDEWEDDGSEEMTDVSDDPYPDDDDDDDADSEDSSSAREDDDDDVWHSEFTDEDELLYPRSSSSSSSSSGENHSDEDGGERPDQSRAERKLAAALRLHRPGARLGVGHGDSDDDDDDDDDDEERGEGGPPAAASAANPAAARRRRRRRREENESPFVTRKYFDRLPQIRHDAKKKFVGGATTPPPAAAPAAAAAAAVAPRTTPPPAAASEAGGSYQHHHHHHHHDEDKVTCHICIMPYEHDDALVILPCLHRFHVGCAKEWLTKNKAQCPTCRHDPRKIR